MVDDPRTECEIKIPVAGLYGVRRRLRQGGWSCVRERTLEVNVLLDTAEATLQAAQQALRLRRYGDLQTLTFKGTPRRRGPVKEREELEVAISDLELTLDLFTRLGFVPAMRYEKRRELWRRQALTVALDHTPMGDFVEVEGPAELLAATARALGLDAEAAVASPYPTLWREYRRTRPGLPHDMVFTP